MDFQKNISNLFLNDDIFSNFLNFQSNEELDLNQKYNKENLTEKGNNILKFKLSSIGENNIIENEIIGTSNNLFQKIEDYNNLKKEIIINKFDDIDVVLKNKIEIGFRNELKNSPFIDKDFDFFRNSCNNERAGLNSIFIKYKYFKIEKNDKSKISVSSLNSNQREKKIYNKKNLKEIKQIKNRISAKRSRLKKKKEIENLIKENQELKSEIFILKKNHISFCLFENLKNIEKLINNMDSFNMYFTEYQILQKSVQQSLLNKLIFSLIPLHLKIFFRSNKNFNFFENCISFEDLKYKINESIFKFNNLLDNNSYQKNTKLIYQSLEFLKELNE